MKFRLAHAALDDLDDIESWTTDHFGAAFASRTYTALFSDFKLLADFPELGRNRPEVTSRPFRFFLSGRYWIIYKVGTPLVIHRVAHHARDLRRIGL